MITKHTVIPENSILKSSQGNFNYIDSFSGWAITKEQTVDAPLFLKLFASGGPKWVDYLLAVRDKIVGVFGLKTGGNKTQPSDYSKCAIGEQVGIFTVFDKAENEFILGENDKHLDFRVSLLVEPSENETNKAKLSITTAVKFNNWFGKLYFLPVKPMHGIIVRKSLKDIIRKMERM